MSVRNGIAGISYGQVVSTELMTRVGGADHRERLELVPASADWTYFFVRHLARPDDTFWTVPGMEGRVRILRRVTEDGDFGLLASWTVLGRRGSRDGVDVVGFLSGNDISSRDTTPACARGLAQLRAAVGPVVRGLFCVVSVELDPDFRGAGLARALYRDMIRFLGQNGRAVGPGVCYRDVDNPHLGHGSTKPVAQRIWDDLANEFPSQGFGKRKLLWGGVVGLSKRSSPQIEGAANRRLKLETLLRIVRRARAFRGR